MGGDEGDWERGHREMGNASGDGNRFWTKFDLLIDVGFYCSKIMLLVNARSSLDKILGDHWFSMGTSGNGSVKRVDVNK